MCIIFIGFIDLMLNNTELAYFTYFFSPNTLKNGEIILV